MIPLAAVCIALAEFLLDHTLPRYQSPWFWISLTSTVALLVLVQVLRFMKSSPAKLSKPDISASTIIRQKTNSDQ